MELVPAVSRESQRQNLCRGRQAIDAAVWPTHTHRRELPNVTKIDNLTSTAAQ